MYMEWKEDEFPPFFILETIWAHLRTIITFVAIGLYNLFNIFIEYWQ